MSEKDADLRAIREAIHRLRLQRRQLISEAVKPDLDSAPNATSALLAGIVTIQEQIEALRRARDDEESL